MSEKYRNYQMIVYLNDKNSSSSFSEILHVPKYRDFREGKRVSLFE